MIVYFIIKELMARHRRFVITGAHLCWTTGLENKLLTRRITALENKLLRITALENKLLKLSPPPEDRRIQDSNLKKITYLTPAPEDAPT